MRFTTMSQTFNGVNLQHHKWKSKLTIVALTMTFSCILSYPYDNTVILRHISHLQTGQEVTQNINIIFLHHLLQKYYTQIIIRTNAPYSICLHGLLCYKTLMLKWPNKMNLQWYMYYQEVFLVVSISVSADWWMF